MHQTTVEYKFQPGDLVTLKAMIEVGEAEGKPQILAVARVRVGWGANDEPSVMYYVRVLCRARIWSTEKSQEFMGGVRLANGWILIDESELVAYDPEEKPDG